MLTTGRGAIIKFLEQQDQRASGTEPFAAANRPDTFTYHFGKGRGVRWHDKPRGLLWLCAFDDAHDRGYEHAVRLRRSGALYPDTEQHAASSASALLPWGTHADEDAHEWAQAIYGALEAWETGSTQLVAGQKISYPAALYLELSKDEDDIWTLVIRRRLAYLHIGAEQRERWLTNGGIPRSLSPPRRPARRGRLRVREPTAPASVPFRPGPFPGRGHHTCGMAAASLRCRDQRRSVSAGQGLEMSAAWWPAAARGSKT